MQRRNFSQRPPFALLPFLLLISASIASWAVVSGGLGLMNKAMIVSPQMQQRAVSAQVAASLAALAKGKTDQSDQIAAQVVKMLGGSSDAYVVVGEEMMRQGHPSEAARLLMGATQKGEINWDPRLWSTLAKAYAGAGNTAGARSARTQAAQRGEAVLQEIGKNAPVTSAEITPETLKFLQTGLYFTDEANNVQSGLRALREAHRLMPTHPLILNALGYTLADKGSTKAEFEEARRLTLQAVKAAPGNSIILDSYGWALYKNGDLAGARRVLREAADDTAGVAEIHHHLAVIYRDLDKKQDALLEFDRALLLKPNDPVIERDRKATLAATPVKP